MPPIHCAGMDNGRTQKHGSLHGCAKRWGGWSMVRVRCAYLEHLSSLSRRRSRFCPLGRPAWPPKRRLERDECRFSSQAHVKQVFRSTGSPRRFTSCFAASASSRPRRSSSTGFKPSKKSSYAGGFSPFTFSYMERLATDGFEPFRPGRGPALGGPPTYRFLRYTCYGTLYASV